MVSESLSVGLMDSVGDDGRVAVEDVRDQIWVEARTQSALVSFWKNPTCNENFESMSVSLFDRACNEAVTLVILHCLYALHSWEDIRGNLESYRKGVVLYLERCVRDGLYHEMDVKGIVDPDGTVGFKVYVGPYGLIDTDDASSYLLDVP